MDDENKKIIYEMLRDQNWSANSISSKKIHQVFANHFDLKLKEREIRDRLVVASRLAKKLSLEDFYELFKG